MRITPKICFSMVFIMCSFFGTNRSFAEVDPFWLRSWEQALANKPNEIVSRSRIAAETEPGIAFVIHGQILNPDGQTPAAGTIVHSYHRDQSGFDFGPDEKDYPAWRLQGWAVTDNNGYFEFKTIRPGPDHLGREGAHIHFTHDSEALGKQWAPTIYFSDDPLVSEERKSESRKNGEFGSVKAVKMGDGVQYINVKIKLNETADFN